jgi:phasin family protein
LTNSVKVNMLQCSNASVFQEIPMQNSTDYIDKTTDSLMKMCSDMSVMVRDSMNAALQSVTVMTKGYEDIWDSVNTIVQKSLENNAQAGRALMSAKSPNDLMDMPSLMMKNSFDGIMAETNRLMQMSSRIAQEAVEPVTQNMNATITRLSRMKAA